MSKVSRRNEGRSDTRNSPREQTPEVVYYETKGGVSSVRNIIQSVGKKDEQSFVKIVSCVEKVMLSFPVPPKHIVKKFRGLYQIKAGDYRVFYWPFGNQIVLLHCIYKTEQGTPTRDIETALKRKRDYEDRFVRKGR